MPNAAQAATMPNATNVLVAWNGQLVRRPVLYEPAAEERGEHFDPGPPRRIIVGDWWREAGVCPFGGLASERYEFHRRRDP